MTHFYDTCSLLSLQDKAFENYFYFSSITIQELERIKTSSTKDEDTKYRARNLLRLLVENKGKYQIYQYNPIWDNEIIDNYGIQVIDDARIAFTAFKNCPNIPFVTDDLSCGMNAEIFGIKVEYNNFETLDTYTGYKEINFTDIELATFYNTTHFKNQNAYDLLENEYLIIKLNGQVVDKYKWFDGRYVEISNDPFNSKMFGKISAKDCYQQCVMDSLRTNQMTIIRGRAGSGKSLLGLGYLFQELERGKIDKIVMFVNPVATRDSCKFGFLPGTFLEKVLGSQIGHFLASKLGGIEYVYQLIDQGKLDFVALADARGYDTTGMNCALYCTEAQNANIEQMKLILSRIGDDTIAIIEGDNLMQTDVKSYEGANNGLRRACEVYAGEDYFGTVTLQNCYRSKIAAKIDEM